MGIAPTRLTRNTFSRHSHAWGADERGIWVKVGLALSGGGFRAALFHLGVMARLAKQGLLPKIQVISTVSGGSIIGAYYVLRLNTELRERGGTLSPVDFLGLMHELELEFSGLAQTNLRLRTFSDLASNLRMLVPRYSRTDRLGEYLDRNYYAIAANGVRGGRRCRVPLATLEAIESARPPVPHLIINATSLNSGHDFRF